MVNEEIISIKNRFVKHLHPECIFLFGSYATDMYTDESDYDFYKCHQYIDSKLYLDE